MALEAANTRLGPGTPRGAAASLQGGSPRQLTLAGVWWEDWGGEVGI